MEALHNFINQYYTVSKERVAEIARGRARWDFARLWWNPQHNTFADKNGDIYLFEENIEEPLDEE